MTPLKEDFASAVSKVKSPTGVEVHADLRSVDDYKVKFAKHASDYGDTSNEGYMVPASVVEKVGKYPEGGSRDWVLSLRRITQPGIWAVGIKEDPEDWPEAWAALLKKGYKPVWYTKGMVLV